MSNLFNPFRYIAGLKSLVWGVIFIVAMSLMLWGGGMIQDGYIHYGFYEGSYWRVLYAEVVFWLLPSLLLMFCGQLLSSSKIRIVDVFGTNAFSRLAILPMVAVTVMPQIQDMMKLFMASLQSGTQPGSADIATLAVVSIVMLLCLVLYYIWSYNAYAVSCNIRGWRAVVSFIVVQLLCTLFGGYLLLPIL